MTHNQWEQGKRLTIYNATKEQLKFMVRERESMIQDLTKQLDEKQKALEDAIKMLKDMIWNKSFFRRMGADMEKIDNNIQLAFLGGMKAGLEALIHGLEVVAENNNGQVSFEFVKMVSASTIADVELKLSSIENGKGLIDALNNKSKWKIIYNAQDLL